MVTGTGGVAGGLGGIALTVRGRKQLIACYSQQPDVAYCTPSLICGVAGLLAWVVVFALVPRMEPIQLDGK